MARGPISLGGARCAGCGLSAGGSSGLDVVGAFFWGSVSSWNHFCIPPQYLVDVAFGFREGRNASKSEHGAWSGIIGGQGHGEVAGVAFHHFSEIACATAQVLLWVEAVDHTQFPCCIRHQLHQSDGASGGDRGDIKLGLCGDDGGEKVGVQTFLPGDFADEIAQSW